MKKMLCQIDNRIRIIGSKNEIETADELIERFYPNISKINEAQARLELQSLIDTENLKVDILFAGNTVWSFERVIRDIKRVVNNGMPSMTNKLYKFLSLCCGSIAHYNKQGWIDTYPTVESLRTFFMRNEFGERVLTYIPTWKRDVKKIVEEIEKILGISYK